MKQVRTIFRTFQPLVAMVFVVALLALGGKAMSEFVQRSDQRVSDQEVNQLIAVIRDGRLRESEPSRVTQAINRLGELRAVQAIDDLVSLLTFKRTFEWESQSKEVINEIQPITPGNRYPATSALAQIGEPALPALVKVLAVHEPNSVESKNSVYAILTIFRENPTQGSQYLKRAAAKASTPEAAERILQVARKLEGPPRQ